MFLTSGFFLIASVIMAILSHRLLPPLWDLAYIFIFLCLLSFALGMLASGIAQLRALIKGEYNDHNEHNEHNEHLR